MPEILYGYSPILLAIIAGTFTYFMTAIGAALVFFTFRVGEKLLDTMLGVASGVMIAASFWSLLEPSIELSRSLSLPVWLPPSAGFLSGAIFLRVVDILIPHLHIGLEKEKAEGIKCELKKTTLLVLAVTLHNIPEGLAVGVAFGALVHQGDITSFMGAISLTVGIGVQNLLEGLAVAFPLRGEGFSKTKSFMLGQASAMVEPVGAVIGAVAVSMIQPIMPYALSFAAGAMIFVVVEDLIPQSQQRGNSDLATMGTILGFIIMMILDVGIGY